MAIPLTYPHNTKSSFSYPRTPPTVPRYDPPRFERTDKSSSIGGHHSLLWISDSVRNHAVAMLGEFVGTTMFLFFGLAAGQIANGKPDTINRTGPQSAPSLLQLIFISSGFGVGLAVNVWIFFRVSGGMFNPAVTTALCLVEAVPWLRGILLIPTQVAAGVAAAAIVDGLLPGTLSVATTLGADTTTWQGLLIEMILTGQLILTILMLAVEKHRATFMAPVGIGLALFIGHLIGVPTTGAGINPARAFGPSVVLRKFVTYHWIYWLGPLLGAILAVVTHKVLKFFQYQNANWGQDDDGLDVYRIVSKRRGSNESTSSLSHLI